VATHADSHRGVDQGLTYEHMFDKVAAMDEAVRTSVTASDPASRHPVPGTGSSSRSGAGNSARNSAVIAVERLLSTLEIDPASLTVNEVREHMRWVASAQAVAAARLMALDERMREIAANAETHVPVDPARELVRNAGLRRRDVRSLGTQAAAADAAPQMGRLLAEGATTAAHLDALGQALQIAGEGGRDTFLGRSDEIARRAMISTVDDFATFVKRLAVEAQPDEGLSRFEQQRRNTFVKVRVDADGMTRGSFAFDPERGAAIEGCLDRQVEAMFHAGASSDVDVAPGIDPNDHRRALALHALCTRTVTSRTGTSTTGSDGSDPVGDTRPARAEVIVHVDLQTLQTGLHHHGVCRTGHGADLPPETVRRIACEAEIIPVVLDGRSVPIDVGRAKRLATMHQRRALEAVHETCAIPDCRVGFSRCVIHHLTPWERGGPTDLGNMVPLCNQHHHAVHDGGWTIILDPTSRRITAAPPLRAQRSHTSHRAA
jgi:hypothetical protein